LSGRLDYLYAALEDTQETIRAIDIKSGFLFLLLCAPAPVVDKIIDAAPNFQQAPVLLRLLIISTSIVWALSGFALFMAVAAIGNAASRTRGAVPSGTYFGADIFNLDWTDSFTDRGRYANFDVISEAARLPKDETAIIEELVYEKIKLTYIRQLKMKRFDTASRLAAVWAPMAIITSLVCRFY
jgi:hypothetical protein